MKRFSNFFIALSGSLLLWAAWPTSPLTLLIFIAWVPLLWIEDNISNWKKLFGLAYVHMLIWNIATTWWIWNASPAGAMGAFIANSLIMCVPWLLFYFTKKLFGRWTGYGSLIIFWLSFEYIHHNWELSWPWLTLGNSFAIHPEWVQWYEYSGSTGGSLWVLLLNIIAYTVFAEYRNNGRTRRYFLTLASWIAALTIPILISRIMINGEKKKITTALSEAVKNVVIVQPNIDPYTEKFTGSIESQIQKLVVLSEQQMDSNTSLVVWPETAIPAQVWEDEIKHNFFYNPVWSFLHRHRNVSLVTGIDSYKNYGPNKKDAPKTARFEPSAKSYYDAFNTAAFFDADTTIQLYHKAKLVPGVETLPSFLNFMGKWFEDFGGISGTLGRDSERKVFVPRDNHFKAAPIICYESIYSDYITEYVRKGANILTIITNDGWWGNTPGYKQHMNYARLRAVETRKWVARSANTGISCFIDPLGNVVSQQPWDTPASIKLAVPVDNRQTFFVKHGDLLSRATIVVSILLIVMDIIFWIKKRR
ncbi:MAG TPA: apolipoprotein N-acyltransferase [Chitinophagaceae bacterium]|nr:apolipoprotein N-acyltransferase [Chitinophagaceae bacterium]